MQKCINVIGPLRSPSRPSRAQPRPQAHSGDLHTRRDEATFYKYAWFYHAKFLTRKIFPKSKDIFISAAALETNKGKAAFKAAFHEAIEQTAGHDGFVMDFPFAVADPCIQVADYCSWAIQRRWERGKDDFCRK